MWPDEQSPGLHCGHWLGCRIWAFKTSPVNTVWKSGRKCATPTNLRSNGLIRTDRPYAGWLFAGWLREDRGKIALWRDLPFFDHLEFDLGECGPDLASLASREQIWFHGLVDSTNPQAWRFQLKNEPGVLVAADRKLLLWDAGRDHPLEAQFIPHAGVMVGNIQTSLKLGTEARLGHNIPSEFAQAIPLDCGGYIFGAIDGRAVAYNEFLDGDAFRSSPSVAKEPLVMELRYGLAIANSTRSTQLHLRVHDQGEFRKQQGNDAYGSINFTYRF